MNQPTLRTVIVRHRAALVVAALLAAVAAVLALAPYVAVYRVAVELFTADGDAGAIPAIAILTAVAIAVRALASGLSSHIAHVAAYRILADLRLAIADKLRTIPLGRVQRRTSGEFKKLLHDDVEQLEEALAHGVPDLAASVAVPVATTVLFFVVDVRLALVAIGALVLLLVVSGAGMAMAQKSNVAAETYRVRLNSAVLGYLNGLTVIRGFLRPDSGYDQTRDAIVAGFRQQDKAMTGPTSWVVSVMLAGTGFAVAAVLPIAGIGAAHGWIGVPTLVLVLVLSLGYLSPLLGLVGVLATLMIRIQFAAGEVSAILAEPPLPEPERPQPVRDASVRFEAVGFSYDGGAAALSNVSLDVPAGTSLALVGPTGAGKSTIARLVARLWDPDDGRILIGGVDVRDIGSQRLARLVAYVQQDEYVFAATLAENIRVARPDATDAEVVSAGVAAQLAEVAADLGGWEAELPAGGGRLSGGQRQRISIARALLKDAEIVVLDEATAHLDAATERHTLAAIEALTAGRTVIAIAHRLDTVRRCDRIAVVEAGEITGTGTHEELLAKHDTYRTLWTAYVAAGGWRLEPGGGPDVAPGQRPGPPIPADEWVAAARAVVTPGVETMSFGRQWRTLYGRGWRDLMRHGLHRILVEAMVRSVPLLAVYLVVDKAVAGELTTTVVWQVFALVVFGLAVRLFASRWTNVYVWRLANRAKADIMLSIIEALRRVPMGFLGRVDRSRIATVVTNDAVLLDFQNVPQQLAAAIVQPAIAAVVLAAIDWRLALAALIGVPLFLVIARWSDRIYHQVFAEVHRARANASTVLLEQARGAAVLRGDDTSRIATRYRDVVEQLRAASVAMSVRATPSSALGAIAVESGLVVLIVVGTVLYDNGSVAASTLLLFLFLALALYQPIQELNVLAGYRRNQEQIAAKIAEVWNEPPLPEPDRGATPDDASIEFDGVTFDYGDRTVLDGVSFTAERGAITALVGPSGAGKSTIANLAARLWDPTAGRVLLGGKALPELGSDAVLAAVTTVYQDVYLFPDSVRFNVTLGRPDASDDEIWAALTAAQCDDLVRSLPEGLDTVVAEGGATLSGGERQRLSIARALLKNSPVLILDEAVSAVDPATEARIQQALQTLAAGRTVLVIAHRLETIRDADRIVVLDHGRVDGVGTHDELVGASAVYRTMLGTGVSSAVTSG